MRWSQDKYGNVPGALDDELLSIQKNAIGYFDLVIANALAQCFKRYRKSILIKLNIPGQILVVDDDDEDHDIMRSACEVLGAAGALKFFYDGHSLLEYLRGSESPPFMILCDINMPHIDGLDLREVIWNDVDLKRVSIPFIFFSTAASPSQIKKAYDLTVQGFFLKGNTMAETVRKLQLILDYWMECKHPNSSKTTNTGSDTPYEHGSGNRA